jgi:hypothetical protein
MAFQDNSDYLKMISAFEQAAATFRPVVSMYGSYMNALVEAGFTRPEALKMTLALQEKVLDAGFAVAFNTKNNREGG